MRTSKHNNILFITRAAVIAAIYVALTVIFAPISFNAIQVRIAEILTILPFFLPEAVPAFSPLPFPEAGSDGSEETALETGTMVQTADGSLLVQTGDGMLLIEAIQPAGKRVMTSAEYLRGKPVRPEE